MASSSSSSCCVVMVLRMNCPMAFVCGGCIWRALSTLEKRARLHRTRLLLTAGLEVQTDRRPRAAWSWGGQGSEVGSSSSSSGGQRTKELLLCGLKERSLCSWSRVNLWAWESHRPIVLGLHHHLFVLLWLWLWLWIWICLCLCTAGLSLALMWGRGQGQGLGISTYTTQCMSPASQQMCHHGCHHLTRLCRVCRLSICSMAQGSDELFSFIETCGEKVESLVICTWEFALYSILEPLWLKCHVHPWASATDCVPTVSLLWLCCEHTTPSVSIYRHTMQELAIQFTLI